VSAIGWPVPEPQLPTDVHPVLAEAVRAAASAFGLARRAHGREALAERVAQGADGTPTMRVDALVEDAIAAVAARHGVNLLSEEVGFVDAGSARTLVIDPLDGSANAAAGVPLSCVAGVLATDGTPTEAVTCWLDTGRCWHAVAGRPVPYRTSGRRELDGAAVSLLRPQERIADQWWAVARRAGRIRILSSSCLEAALVAEGSTDAFADAGSDTHRIVDLAAAVLMVPAAGGAVLDVHGRPLDLDPDLTRRWSGVVAATPQLAEELAATIAGADDRPGLVPGSP
jgi:myo-inositol-1(or 4)-monophosphatase